MYAEPALYSHGPGEYTEEMTIKIFMKKDSTSGFVNLAVGESVTYDLSIRVATNANGGYISTDSNSTWNKSVVKVKITKLDKAQVGGGD